MYKVVGWNYLKQAIFILCVCVCMLMSANHTFPTIAKHASPHTSHPGIHNTMNTEELLSSMSESAGGPCITVLKNSTWVRSFVPSEGSVLFQIDSLVQWTVQFYLHLLSLLHYKFSTEIKSCFVSCGLTKYSRAVSRFIYENILPPLRFFTSS